jgi:hypothetical protein
MIISNVKLSVKVSKNWRVSLFIKYLPIELNFSSAIVNFNKKSNSTANNFRTKILKKDEYTIKKGL